jgi:hypothetical protein
MKSNRVIVISLIFILIVFSISTASDYSNIRGEYPVNNTGYVYHSPDPNIPPPEKFNDITDWGYAIGAPVLSSIRLGDVNGDDVDEVIFTSYGPPPNPYSAGMVLVFDISGNLLPGWPVITNSPFAATAAVGDLDNDGIAEIIAGDWSRIHIFNNDGSAYPGWPIANGVNYSPALEDLDGDGDLEIIYPSGNRMYVRHHDGTLFGNFPVSAPDDLGSPAVADIDGDNELEIIAGTLAGPVGPEPYEVYVWNLDGSMLEGFPVETSGVVKATPAVGDVDNDGLPEIVVASYDTSNNDYLYCFDHTGNIENGWPVRVPYCRLSSPALADLDNDDDLEIIIGGLRTSPEWMEMLFGFHHDGQPLANFPVDLPHAGAQGNINSSPVIAEVDGDGEQPEIFVKVVDHIFALHADGSIMEGFPHFLSDDNSTGTHSPSPALGDLDRDGDSEFIFCSCSGNVELLDVETAFDPKKSFWPVYKHDPYATSNYGGYIIIGVDEQPELPEEFSICRNYPNPFNSSTTFEINLDRKSDVKLEIFNLAGQRIAILLDEVTDRGLHRTNWNADGCASGIYFYRLTTGGKTLTKRMLLLK